MKLDEIKPVGMLALVTHDLFKAQNLLSKHGISGQESFKHLGEDFISNMEKVELSIEQLDKKLSSKQKLLNLTLVI